jgi:hypothetical protein
LPHLGRFRTKRVLLPDNFLRPGLAFLTKPL